MTRTGAHRLGMDEVEAGLVGIDLRALLLHVLAEHFAQRLVHQVGDRVVACGGRTGGGVDARRHRIADPQAEGLDDAVVAEHRRLNLLRVLDGE